MKIGERVEKISTKAHYRILDTSVDGRIVLQRLIIGGNSENVLEVDDLRAFKLVREFKDTISFFDGDYSFLANSFESPVEYEGIKYSSVEHAFQASKTDNKEEKEKIMNASSPTKARVIGRRVTKKDNWEDTKNDIMYQICLNKFKDNEELKKKLLSTGNYNLINGNTSEDTYWGVCKEVGDNYLGKILMQIREELKD